MAGTKRTAEQKAIHVFNCDNLCSLSEVESLLKAVEKNVAFKISKVEQHKFRGGEIAGLVEKTIPNLRGIDYAVFFVHAHESSLAFSEDSGYGKIYEALTKRIGSGEKVLIVIGGDDNYKDKDEEDRCFLSRWAKKKAISCQFRTEFLDGRKSFIFSWNKKHRPIHEEALLHYFDPSKKGQKFEYQPKSKPLVVPETEESKITPLTVVDIQEGEPEEEPESSQQELTSNEEDTVDSCVDEQDGGRVPSDEIEESEIQVSSEGSQVSSSSGSLMLETLLRHGKISFDTKDVVIWDGSWRPSESDEEDLEQNWKSTPVANLKIFVDENNKIQDIVVEPTKTRWCSIS